MKIVITGASGNVGTGLLRALAGAPERHRVVGICRRPPPPRPPYDGIDWVALDLGAPGAERRLAGEFAGADAVVHLAWAIQPVRDEAHLHRVNVDGTRAVLAAARTAGVGHVVHASSLAVYAAASGEQVDERHPATGLAGSVYSRNKVAAECLVSLFAAANPEVTVTSLRPTLVTQRTASASLTALFLGPLIGPPLVRLLGSRLLPVLPLPSPLRVQLVHADDLGEAILSILARRTSGAVNVAAPEVLTAADVAAALNSRSVPVPARVVRPVVSALWRLRLLRCSPGWFDVALTSPTLDTTRARAELGWQPRVSGQQALREQLDGIAAGAEGDSPALRRTRLRRA
ncbi:NAD-dependent epimerase/dehydratase family protein [Crossiella sp. CA-258035]|uniref:NAD-dependent epimerase/dehydratase family protein n=1 Tax=Crossiella sp. CA-258035 TaxID=2981138 RepID=UPI0024BC326E|nr:NAD-dependent epimerase/dehydratase family protein [Crossiella sp. CA-258035]WHT22946.1 NAD-dependent epimerase/dehydratase family protein [Crossiella sp. CA-258035]